MKKALLLSRHCLLLFLMAYHPALGQQAFLTKVSPPEDVTFGGITGIAQDKEGFLWLATYSGLHRYDGYRYLSYSHDPEDGNTIASNKTETVFISKSGIIWIGTFLHGLDRFDPVSKTFTHFTHDPSDPSSLSDNTVTAILEDRLGVLWVGTHGGLHRFHPESGTFTRYRHNPQDPTTLSNDQVRTLYEDRQGTLWVGTGSPWESKPGEGGLNRFDRGTGTFTRYMHDPKDPSTLIDNKVRAIFEDSRGTFWVGTLGDGLHTMDRAKGTFTRHRHDPRQPDKLSRSPVIGNNQDAVTFVHEDVTGVIWIGANGGGLSRYDPEKGKVEHFVAGTKNAGGLQDNAIWWAHSSKEGVLWVGTLIGDLYRTDPLRVSFTYQPSGASVFGIYEDAAGRIWAGTGKGLKVYEQSRGNRREVVAEIPALAGLANEPVVSFLEDRGGTLWIGGVQGLWRFDPAPGTLTLYAHDPKSPGSIGEGHVAAILEGSDGYLWVGTGKGGLHRFDPKTGAFVRFQHDPKNPSSLSHNYVSAIHEDRQGNLWVGTWSGGGLNQLDKKSGRFKRYLADNHNITSIQEDRAGRLLVGSDYSGLYMYQKEKEKFVRYKDQLAGRSIATGVKGMVQDDEGNLWVSSQGGLIKLDQEGGIVANYGEESGLKPQFFNIWAAHKGRKGHLFFGDHNGFFSFLPQKNRLNQTPPHIELTDFRLFDQPVGTGPEGPLPVPLRQATEISLNHDQNVFSFDFTGIHFTNPSENRFLFMLENYDENWRQVNSDHTASYFKVPPGQYVFRVKAASSEGVWAEKALSVVVRPPWWRTWWAYGVYGLLLAGLVFTMDRMQRRRIILKERERTRERELAQAREIEKAYNELRQTQNQLIQSEKMASLGELTAGIAHEIQNPLNFVTNFSEVSTELVEELKQEANAEHKEGVLAIAADLEQNLQKIHHHGKRADAIVKNMLQHSRSSSGEKQTTNLNALADEYLRLAYHGLRAKDKSFTCTLDTCFELKLEKVEVVPQELGRVLLNLYNNAFYAVQQKQKQGLEGYEPKVTVSTHQREGQVEIRVRDNGTGMPEIVKSKVFQPFFTTKPTGQGTGLGLSLSYDIITKGHGGELQVDTVQGEYTEMIVRLPAHNYAPVPIPTA